MTAEGDLIKLMQEDASFQPEDKMGKIGAVATDIAEIDIEIQELKEKLKHIEQNYQKKFYLVFFQR